MRTQSIDTTPEVDIILTHDTAFDSLVSQRVNQLSLMEGYQPIRIISPEDLVLMKLKWYQDGEATADDQWNDILGVLIVQAPFKDLMGKQMRHRVLMARCLKGSDRRTG